MEGRKILVIDDDKQICKLLEHTFSLEKAQVYTVTDSRKAMREFYTCQPDLVFLDILMPEVDGWELCRHAGRVRTYSQILQNVWGSEYRDSVEYVHVYIHKLRQKLEGDVSKPVYLLTEHGVGYRFA